MPSQEWSASTQGARVRGGDACAVACGGMGPVCVIRGWSCPPCSPPGEYSCINMAAEIGRPLGSQVATQGAHVRVRWGRSPWQGRLVLEAYRASVGRGARGGEGRANSAKRTPVSSTPLWRRPSGGQTCSSGGWADAGVRSMGGKPWQPRVRGQLRHRAVRRAVRRARARTSSWVRAFLEREARTEGARTMTSLGTDVREE